jgi:hypothetical protein
LPEVPTPTFQAIAVSTVSATTGFTPYYLLHGREAKTKLDGFYPLHIHSKYAEKHHNYEGVPQLLRGHFTDELRNQTIQKLQEREARRYKTLRDNITQTEDHHQNRTATLAISTAVSRNNNNSCLAIAPI